MTLKLRKGTIMRSVQECCGVIVSDNRGYHHKPVLLTGHTKRGSRPRFFLHFAKQRISLCVARPLDICLCTCNAHQPLIGWQLTAWCKSRGKKKKNPILCNFALFSFQDVEDSREQSEEVDDSRVYEMQLSQLQEQLVAAMIEKHSLGDFSNSPFPSGDIQIRVDCTQEKT